VNLNDVMERIAQIHADAGDDERQHELEDALYVSVLQAIAQGAPNAAELAAAALKTQDMSFSRWYA